MTPLSFSNIKSTFCSELPGCRAKHREAKALISQAGNYTGTVWDHHWVLDEQEKETSALSDKNCNWYPLPIQQLFSSVSVCDIESWACHRAKLDPENTAMGSISGTSSGSHASACEKQQGREEALGTRVRRQGENSSQKSPICIFLRVKSYLLRNEWHWQRGCQSSHQLLFHSRFPSPSTAPDTEPGAKIVSTHVPKPRPASSSTVP